MSKKLTREERDDLADAVQLYLEGLAEENGDEVIVDNLLSAAKKLDLEIEY